LELIQLYQMGWATLQELINGIQREHKREAGRNKRTA
jgi:hypothetical protein